MSDATEPEPAPASTPTIDCVHCGARVPLDFAIADGGRGIDVRCAACRKSFAIAARTTGATETTASTGATVATPTELAADAMRCPKCDTTQPIAAACRACGLAADRMADFARAEDGELPPSLLAAWARLADAWADAAAHERVMQVAATTGSYAWVARQYRAAGRDRPGDARVASQLARIARMTEATLRATAAARPGKASMPYRATLVILILLVAGAGAGVVWAMSMRGGGDPSPADNKARPAVRAP